MNDIKHQVEDWWNKGKEEWYESVRNICNLPIRQDSPSGKLFIALRKNIEYAAEFEEMLLHDEKLESYSLEQLQKLFSQFYADVMPCANGYEASFANPDYAVAHFGNEMGQLLSVICSTFLSYRYYARIGAYSLLKENNDLFKKLFDLWQNNGLDYDQVLSSYKGYVLNELEMKTLMNLYINNDPDFKIFRNLLESLDYSDPRYLYRFGIYVDENSLRMSRFIAEYPEKELMSIAKYFVDAYLVSFERMGKDYKKKELVRLVFPLGMERLAVMVMEELRKFGLTSIIGMPRSRGYNEQFHYDHRYDQALCFDQDYADTSFRIFKDAMDLMTPTFKKQSGTMLITLFGEQPFIPVPKETAVTMNEEQDKIQRLHNNRIQRLYFEKMPRQETSFSIIAFPSTEIGDKFEDIFKDTLELNYLDSMHYARLQEKIIELLDQAEHVHIKGVPGNDTDIIVQLQHINDPAKETNFENCVADVNIPVGEVFTSPRLTGTNGTLHVEDIYLQNVRFYNLKIHFKDGMVSDYSCTNYDSNEKNRNFVFENLLKPHKSLPIGEFAVGTNTKAYRMAKKYDIQYLLPILIIEKMGPHFAIGDTCFSFQEDHPHYGLLSKKRIIAVENEKSCLRKTNPQEAYFAKHCDITLPYDMLHEIAAVKKDGTRLPIIQNGRFVVPGTEELNIPLTDISS